MAKINFGPIVADARNKQGNVVFSRNRYGSYSRPYILTPNPNSSPQQIAKAAWTAAGVAWSTTLTPDQRAAWRAFATRYALSDVFGNQYFADGHDAHQRINMNLLMASFAAFADPPLDQQVGGPGIVTATPDSPSPGALTVATSLPPATGEAAQIWAAPAKPAGWTYFFRNLRLLATMPADDPGPWDIADLYTAAADAWTTLNPVAYPDPQPGNLVGVGVRYLNTANGATSPIVTAAGSVPAEGFDMLKKATVTLTAADIEALPGTPFQLIPTPGPGKVLQPIAAFASYHTGATPFDFSPQLSCNLAIDGNPAIATLTLNLSDLNGPATDAYITAQLIVPSNIDADPTQVADKPLMLTRLNGGAGTAVGDGTMNVTTYYTLDTL